jgi:hypothetical protein
VKNFLLPKEINIAQISQSGIETIFEPCCDERR